MNLQDYIAALTIWREARGESYRAKLGVAHTLRNRLRSKRWPDELGNVCMQSYQFSCFNKDDPNFKKWPDENSSVWRACIAAWMSSALTPDLTNGANHYHSYNDVSRYPYWANSGEKTIEIGAFKFYRL